LKLASPSTPSVFIIILNFNSKEDIFDCIESVLVQNYKPFEIIIVDNGSIDDSVKELKQRYPEITLIENGTNLGYAQGNNIGMRYALDKGADYVVILNPDTVVNENWLSGLISTGERYKDVGIIGSKLLMFYNPDLINSYGHNLTCIAMAYDNGFGKVDGADFGKEKEVMSVCGASFAIKSAVIKKVGYLDKIYFNYYEDVDYCIRSIYAGFKVMVTPDSVVYHKVSKGTASSSSKAIFWSKRNQYLFMLKYFPFSKFLKYSPQLLKLEYRQIYNLVVFNKSGLLLKIVVKALMSAVIKSPIVLFGKMKLLSKKAGFDFFSYLSNDTSIPIMPDAHPDYRIFDPSTDTDEVPSRIYMGINDRILGHGWCNLYRKDYLVYRWFTKRAKVFLKAPKSVDCVIQIHAIAPLSVLRAPLLSIFLDSEKVGEAKIHSHNGEWNTLSFPVKVQDKKLVKVTLELDDYISVKSRDWVNEFGCIVNEVSILEKDSVFIRNNASKIEIKDGLHQDCGHIEYDNRITDYRYEMEILEKSEKIDGRNNFFFKLRVKNTSNSPWLYFHHEYVSNVTVGMRLYDSKGKDHPRKMYHVRFNKNLFPGDEEVVTLLIPPLLREGLHTIKLDLVEEFICWFEEKGAKPISIEVNL
jgi:GT2 family glycosyltransferase